MDQSSPNLEHTLYV